MIARCGTFRVLRATQDTYARVVNNAEKEYAFKRYSSFYFHEHVMLTLPPVLNAPVVLWDALRYACSSRGGEGSFTESPRLSKGKVAPTATATESQLAERSLLRQRMKDMAMLDALADALPTTGTLCAWVK